MLVLEMCVFVHALDVLPIMVGQSMGLCLLNIVVLMDIKVLSIKNSMDCSSFYPVQEIMCTRGRVIALSVEIFVSLFMDTNVENFKRSSRAYEFYLHI